MQVLKLIQIGDSVGVILPEELMAELGLEKGDTLYLTAGPDGMHITPFGSASSEQVDAARVVLQRRRAVLRELAK